MQRYLYFTVFASGMVTLAVEMGASRLLGSSFGDSNLVWASIIGLILIYLTAGYFVGGRWADRSPYIKTLFTILIWGAFFSGVAAMVARPVLRVAANAFDQLQLAVLAGSFTSVLILFSIPITLLGMISPFAIRLAMTDARHAGSIAGKLYGISTMGSFIGTFLPELIFIPWIGTVRTFLLFSGLLTLTAIVGMWRFTSRRQALAYLWMPLSLALMALWGAGGPIKNTAGQIYETESTYNYIQVLEIDGFRYLRLNEGQGIHSIWHPEQIVYGGPWQQFLAAPFFNAAPHGIDQVEDIAIVGLAAGTIPRQATAVFGPVAIDGYEIDPQIIEVGRTYFDMNLPNLNAIAQDGRWGLVHSSRRYSVIGVDAYRPPYIPWHLTTREFFQIVYDHLDDDGVMVINVGRSPSDRSLINALASTIGAVFPSVYVMDVPDSFNSIIYATRQKTEILDLYRNFEFLKQQDGVHPLLLQSLEWTILYQQPTPSGWQVFTDDWSPIEWITNSLVLNYILSDEVESLY